MIASKRNCQATFSVGFSGVEIPTSEYIRKHVLRKLPKNLHGREGWEEMNQASVKRMARFFLNGISRTRGFGKCGRRIGSALFDDRKSKEFIMINCLNK